MSNARNWAPCAIVLLGLVVVGLWWYASTDPFCQDGYIAVDGTCAWE